MNTQTLGTRANASLIRAFVLENSWERKFSSIRPWIMQRPPKERVYRYWEHEEFDSIPPPEGWTYLGSGWSRIAFLGPDGVVYKVAKKVESAYSKRTGMTCNATEAKRFKNDSVKVQSSGFRLAMSRLLWPSVIAMEYVEKVKEVDWRVCERVERATGISDLHPENLWIGPDGMVTLIDYAA